MTAAIETTPRGKRRHAQIVDAAASLFHERGYHETTMDAIAESVGVRKASLYYYFTSKDQLLVEIHQDMIDLIIDQQSSRALSDMEPSTQLLGIMTDLVRLMESHPGRLRIFFEHFRELPEDVRSEIAVKRDQYRDLVIEVLEKGRAEGQFAFDDVLLTAMQVLGVCNWTYQWFRPGGRYSAAEVAESFHRQMLAGLQSR